jgi:hypothetical protein
LEDVGIMYGHLVYFTDISYILWHFRIFCGHFDVFFPVLEICTKKNLATLVQYPPSMYTKWFARVSDPGSEAGFWK